MSPAQVAERVNAELARGDAFDNWHGITAENVRQCLVPPVVVQVSDEPGGEQTPMWLVLQAHGGNDAYVVLLDTQGQEWAVGYREADGSYTLVVGAETLAAALTGM